MTPTIRRSFGASAFGATAGPLSLGKPTAAYPGAVATDSDLTIAVDRQQTRLALPLNTTDTSMTVVTPSIIVPYCLLTIDAETVKVTGPPVGNVVPISRAFDGTTAAVHLASAVVSGFVDAYHHNRLVAEVEAIENALGANLSKIPSVSQTVSSAFDFPAQTPGGTLLAGNNVINITPVPLGVNGSDQNHYLYVSGGTGTAEAVLITGGTAVSGAPSGTLIIQCANTHSGAWTIRSATAGIQEAVNTLPNGGTVIVPAGTSNVFAQITVSTQYIRIRGDGGNLVQSNQISGAVFFFTAIGNGSGGPYGFSNGAYGLKVRGPASPGTLIGIQGRGQLSMRIDDCDIQQVFRGIYVNDTAGAVTSSLWIYRSVISAVQNGIGIHILGGADHYLVTNLVASNPSSPSAAGILLEATVGTKIIGNDVYGCASGMVMAPGNGEYVSAVESIGNWYDSSSADNFKIAPQGTGIVSEIISSEDRMSSGSGNGVSILGTSSNILGVIISSTEVSFNHGQGIYYAGGTAVEINNCQVYGNSIVSPGTNHGLNIAPGAGNLRVHGGTYGQIAGLPGSAPANTQGYGIFINGGSSDNVIIENAVVTPNVSGGLLNGGMTGTHNRIQNNLGYNPVGQSAITVGASPFTYTAGPSPETVYISGGTVSNIKVGSTTVLAASPAQLALAPNQAITVTYTAAPAMVRDVQ